MSYLRKYKLVLILFGLGIFLNFFFYLYITDLYVEDLYLGLVTFLVGTFAIWLYIKQKEDFKRDTAAAFLMEIRFAERKIADLRAASPDFDAWVTLLPTSSWNQFGHMFTDVFDQDELDAINNFYVNCGIIEKAASLLDPSSQVEAKATAIQSALANLAVNSDSTEDYKKKKVALLEILHQESYTFTPHIPMARILKALDTLNNISTTSVGAKLKKVANQLKGE